MQCYNDSKNSLCVTCCEFPTKASVAAQFRAAGYVALVKWPKIHVETLPNLTTICGDYGNQEARSLKSFYNVDVVMTDDVNGSMAWLDDDDNSTATPVVVWLRQFFPGEMV